jgi:type II secretory pathway component GspD/PulD (secretin)
LALVNTRQLDLLNAAVHRFWGAWAGEQRVTMFPLVHLDANSMREPLLARLRRQDRVDVAVIPDTNTLVVRANAQATARARQVLREFDVADVVCVIDLRCVGATGAARTLRRLLGNDPPGVVVVPDAARNRVLIRASATKVRAAKAIVAGLERHDH